MKLSLSEMLSYTTVRLECIYDDNPHSKPEFGTGFFYSFDIHIPGLVSTVIITNKHVVEKAHSIKFLLCKKNLQGMPIDNEHVTFTLDQKYLVENKIDHPNPVVDLCVILLPRKILLNSNKFSIFPLDNSYLPTEDQLNLLFGLEDILMIGYPNGLYDEYNNKPIFRKGITAGRPTLDYNNKKKIMIDIPCFKGSSGSPVFIFNEMQFCDKEGLSQMSSRCILLGIFEEGPNYSILGDMVHANENARVDMESQMPMNLGFVIKSEEILEFERFFKPSLGPSIQASTY